MAKIFKFSFENGAYPIYINVDRIVDMTFKDVFEKDKEPKYNIVINLEGRKRNLTLSYSSKEEREGKMERFKNFFNLVL